MASVLRVCVCTGVSECVCVCRSMYVSVGRVDVYGHACV